MADRHPLNTERIVEAAVAVADRGGVVAISMRNVGRELGVEAMSLYHHVANKDTLLDAIVDWVFEQITLPPAGAPWREAMQVRARSARDVLVAHPWALTLIDSRSQPGPPLLRHHDAVIGCLRDAGFSLDLTAQAFSVIDAYVYGFALTERNLPFDPGGGQSTHDFVAQVMPALAPYPHVAALVRHQMSDGDYSFSIQFDQGLAIILDELERRVRP